MRCAWCDTAYAYDQGDDLSIDEVVAKVERLDCPNICLTGGEPLLQANIQDLIDVMKARGSYVAVETNGTVDIGKFSGVDRFVVDYKLPSACAELRFCDSNFDALSCDDELKFVISDRNDYEAAKRLIGAISTPAKKLMSPCKDSLVRDLADWIVADNLGVRYSLQIHKAVWGGEAKSR